jgi:AmmeMemoRadiSam system protein B
VAGLFYPADPSELESTVEDLLAHCEVEHGSGRICALIVPHAGYVYSGSVAAEASPCSAQNTNMPLGW